MSNKRYKEQNYIHNPLTYDEIVKLIHYYLSEFQDKYNIESLSSITQSQWSAALTYVGYHAFNNTIPVKYHKSSILDYTDSELLYRLVLYYIYLCQLYNKAVSILNYCQLTKIDTLTIYAWKDDKSDIYKSSIYKTLYEMRETTLSDKLISNDYKSPVGIIAVLNHERNWNMSGSVIINNNQISSADLQSISSRYNNAAIEQNPDSGMDPLQNMATLPDSEYQEEN